LEAKLDGKKNTKQCLIQSRGKVSMTVYICMETGKAALNVSSRPEITADRFCFEGLRLKFEHKLYWMVYLAVY
jgi:hypothetical protein